MFRVISFLSTQSNPAKTKLWILLLISVSYDGALFMLVFFMSESPL